MQGNVDNDGQLSARTNYKWNNWLVTKADTQIAPGPGPAMLQLDNEITGKDFSAGLKAVNPSIIEGGVSGIFIGSYLQSLTPSLAVGLEAVWSRAALNAPPETAVSYVAKYRGLDWIASAQLQPQGAVSTSYWRKLTDRVEAGADLNLQFAPGSGGRGGLMGSPMRKEGTATLGAKYDFRNSTFRAQVDSTGKLSCLLEKRVLPPVQLTFAGEIDHFKVSAHDFCVSKIASVMLIYVHVQQQAKIGLAVSIEAAGEELMQQQEQAGGNVAPPAVPF